MPAPAALTLATLLSASFRAQSGSEPAFGCSLVALPVRRQSGLKMTDFPE